ncbi:hypothetical protein BpHYR1_022954 [Brachionus plicatilis]|uniref:Uncharacterized protein n=1 Tax=Brachionus plicatilis TaxID=10195 RepID=A0A3M7PUQ8_BRAPC|nr:hypothetical protein BpHYR1_022954 [Brachionus plicatilis]
MKFLASICLKFLFSNSCFHAIEAYSTIFFKIKIIARTEKNRNHEVIAALRRDSKVKFDMAKNQETENNFEMIKAVKQTLEIGEIVKFNLERLINSVPEKFMDNLKQKMNSLI